MRRFMQINHRSSDAKRVPAGVANVAQAARVASARAAKALGKLGQQDVESGGAWAEERPRWYTALFGDFPRMPPKGKRFCDLFEKSGDPAFDRVVCLATLLLFLSTCLVLAAVWHEEVHGEQHPVHQKVHNAVTRRLRRVVGGVSEASGA